MLRTLGKNSMTSILRYKMRACSSVTSPQRDPTVSKLYKVNVVAGSLSFDEKQFKLVKLLDKLQNLIEQEHGGDELIPKETATQTTTTSEEPGNPAITPAKRLRGVYMYGEVGTGKTMLMDMFFSSVQTPHKRRVHFSEFMLEVHRRIHQHKQQLLAQYGRDIHLNLSSERDSILIVAQLIASEAHVLCFDEFQVTDICDAMILSRLFNELWKQNVVLVATSNRPPTDLYLNGLNRPYFLPFIERLQQNCIVRDIGIETDYRQGGDMAPNAYFTPNNQVNESILHGLYLADLQAKQAVSHPVTIPVMNNRQLTLQEANLDAGVCFVSFAALCESDKGASDYQALCSHFHTVYMPNIPVLSVLMHNEARRLITLIDAMYNRNVRFVWAADALPAQLFEILTSEQLQGVDIGTDHSWHTKTENKSNRHSTGTSGESGEINERNLRGAEQPRRPLDSNMYFGTSMKLTSAGTRTSASASASACVDGDGAATDAAQDELKVLEGELASVQELSFAFRRAASRLTEMSSVGYLKERWSHRVVQ